MLGWSHSRLPWSARRCARRTVAITSASGEAASCGVVGQAVEAREPGPEFHAAFEVDGPDRHVAARAGWPAVR